MSKTDMTQIRADIKELGTGSVCIRRNLYESKFDIELKEVLWKFAS